MTTPAGTATLIQSATVLGKRRALKNVDTLVLHLASSPEPSCGPSDSDFELVSSSNLRAPPDRPVLVNGKLVPHTKKLYKCMYKGCDRSYSKPSRLAEHERSHTGDRPFVCETCDKSYLRESHLQAHVRTHLPQSARPLACPEINCIKRFWTTQHLRVHTEWHSGARPYKCTEATCDESFAKTHQLRAHICMAHAPQGTKPYRCNHEGCTKSFATNQHLRAHTKVHDEKRYACVHFDCLVTVGSALTYFRTWTALQHHVRTAHPPKCTHPSCNGRIFSNRKGLRAHQKLHEQRADGEQLDAALAESAEDDESPRKKRRGGEFGRDWKCEAEGCEKDFKSKYALTVHTNVTHLNRRDFVCPHESCKRAYGHKHLLQRHLRAHRSSTFNPGSSSDEDEGDGSDEINIRPTSPSRNQKPSTSLDIDIITGSAYAKCANTRITEGKALRCPYPRLDGLAPVSPTDLGAEGGDQAGSSCDYAFGRAYDLRRHLKTAHGIAAVKESVDEWVKETKRARH